jgi:hypothetical protein
MLIMYLQSYSHRLVTQCFCVLLLACLSVSQAHAAVPVISSEQEVAAVVGEPFSYTIVAEHQPLGYSVANIPSWLQRDGAKLSGTPAVPSESVMQLTALNRDGVSQSVELTVRVSAPSPPPVPLEPSSVAAVLESTPNGD